MSLWHHNFDMLNILKDSLLYPKQIQGELSNKFVCDFIGSSNKLIFFDVLLRMYDDSD